MPLRRAVERGDTSRTFHPPRHLKIARGLIELCRVVPVMCSAALAVLVVGQLMTIQAGAGFVAAAVLAGPLLLAAGVVAAGVTTAMKWLLVGRFRPVEHPLWSSFVWRDELADTFVEVLAVPWLVGHAGGTPVLTAWLRSMGASIGRGVWLETYWLPESDLVRLGDGATVNRGCVVQTHLFHDRIMSMDEVRIDEGATLGPNGIILPGAASARGRPSARARWSRAATPSPRRPAGWATRSRRGAEPQTDGRRGPVDRPVPARPRQRRVPGRALRPGHRLQARGQPAHRTGGAHRRRPTRR